MGRSILKYICFLLLLASGFAAAILGLTQYGVQIDFDAWARVSGEIINRIPVLLSSPMVVEYGFYGGMAIFLVFLVLFVFASLSGRKDESESDYSFDETEVDSFIPAPGTRIEESESEESVLERSEPEESTPDAVHLAETVEAESIEADPLETGSLSNQGYASSSEAVEIQDDEDEYESAKEEFERNKAWLESLDDAKS